MTFSVNQHLTERVAGHGTWDVARIRAKGYTDNVVDLIMGKLMQLPDTARAAIQQLACLGNVVEISTMRLALRKSEREIHTSLLEAARGPAPLKHNIVHFSGLS
jgi:predicted ATPase